MYDIIIVGGGAAGLSAALYTSRRTLKTLVITKDLGGQAATTPKIENYPGIHHVEGTALMRDFMEQAQKYGAEFIFDEVIGLIKNEDFEVKTENGTYQAKSVILAFGLTPRNLDVPGERKLGGKGVCYCATCDAPLYKGKEVAVIGGGSAALDAAILLSKIAAKVYLIHRRDAFRGEQVLLERLKTLKNLEIILNSKVKEIKGEKTVEKLVVVDVNDESEEREISLQGVFVEIGFIAKTGWLGDLVEFNDKKEIIANKDCETKTTGLFAAGDVTNVGYKQVVISAGEGAKAGLRAYQYLLDKEGRKGALIDWS